MLTYSFNNKNKCLYKALYENIKSDIQSGKLTPNEKLPSKRSLAENLNVSVITVQNAYQMLISEGYIYSMPKKGYFVSKIDIIKSKTNYIFKNDTKKIVKSYKADFKNNKIPYSDFPFSVWQKCMRETLLDTGNEKLLSKNESGGIIDLKKAISKHLYNFRGMNVNPDQIIIGAGTEYLYGLLVQFFGYDKIYTIENPGYKKLFQIYNSYNIKCIPVDLDENGLNIANLRNSNAQIVHISPSHHFPTGIRTPVSRRYEILKWACESSDRYIIEDDYDCEFKLNGSPIRTMQSIDTNEKVIYINTFSKSLSPSFRISYMILPFSLIDKFYNKLGFYSCTVSNFEQYALAKFIEEGYFERHINRMRKHYRNIRDDIIKEISSSKIAHFCKIKHKDEGLHFIIHVNSKFDDSDFLKISENHGLNISCVSDYCFFDKKINSNDVIVSFSGIDEKKVSPSVNLLIDCISEEIQKYF